MGINQIDIPEEMVPLKLGWLLEKGN